MKDQIRSLRRSDAWDYENGFYWFSPKSRLNKMLAHYELYKMIVDLPGHIFELGVYKGASLVRFATFRDVLENDWARKIVGFDAFGDFPTNHLEAQEDLKFIEEFQGAGGAGLSEVQIQHILASKGFDNYRLVKGNVLDTLPKYLTSYPESRIALLHLDMDVKEPTDFALELLYDRIVPGGVIVLDDYNAVAGATLGGYNFIFARKLRLEKLTFYNAPAFIRKPV